MAVRLKATVPIGAGATSGYVYIGQGKNVYTIYTLGGYTGVLQVFSSPDAFVGGVPTTGTPTDFAEFGEVPGATSTETTLFNTAGLSNGAIVTIRHPIQAIVFKSSAGVTVAPATIYIMLES